MIKGAINKLGQYMSETFDFNKATLSGCIDIIVVEQPDGSLKSSSFHVRFGKFKVLKTKERVVTIHINGVQQQFNMKLETSGQAYFEEYREQKDIRKFSEDINPSESEYDIQSPSEDEDTLISPSSELNTADQLDASQLEKNQEKDLQKMEKMFNDTSLSPKSNKGIMDSLIKMFKSKKNIPGEESNRKENNGGEELSSPKKQQNNNNNDTEQQSAQKESGEQAQQQNITKEFSINIQENEEGEEIQTKQQQQPRIMNKKKLTIEPQTFQIPSCEDLDIESQQQQNEENQNTQIEQQPQFQDKAEEDAGYQHDDEEDEYDEDDDTIELSLCSHLINKQNEDDPSDIFEQNKVPFEKFVQDPLKILTNKNLLVRIKDELYTYELAVSILICQQAYKQELPYDTKRKMLKKKEGLFSKLFSSKQKSPEIRPQQQSAQDIETQSSSQQQQSTVTSHSQTVLGQEPVSVQNESQNNQQKEPVSDKKPVIKNLQQSEELSQSLSHEDQQQQGVGNDNPLVREARSRKLSDDQMSINSESSQSKGKQRIKKTFRPKNTVLDSFKLKPGRNTITFTVKTELQGEQTVEGSIFYYKGNTQIVISDIDGTITKSDVLGQLMPMVGKEWSHEGVVDLYNSIQRNGYEVLYLTARAIGQTRDFIESLEQDGIKLPEGPIIMSPDRVLKSFKREVIHKKPEIFKIVALRDIQGLFQCSTPFYAGFGNRDTDAIAYKAVGVTMGRIFIINPNGQLFQFNNTYNKTYKELNEMVDDMFPATAKEKEILEDKYNNSNYWGQVNPYANVDIDSLLE